MLYRGIVLDEGSKNQSPIHAKALAAEVEAGDGVLPELLDGNDAVFPNCNRRNFTGTRLDNQLSIVLQPALNCARQGSAVGKEMKLQKRGGCLHFRKAKLDQARSHRLHTERLRFKE